MEYAIIDKILFLTIIVILLGLRRAIIMKTAAISKLKASLSQYLSMVKSGEEVLITDRGNAIAKIVPLGTKDTKMPTHLMELMSASTARQGLPILMATAISMR